MHFHKVSMPRLITHTSKLKIERLCNKSLVKGTCIAGQVLKGSQSQKGVKKWSKGSQKVTPHKKVVKRESKSGHKGVKRNFFL